MPSSSQIIERAKPLLGTFVSVRVQGLEPVVAHAAINAAFAEIAAVHSLMSFHEPDSDLSRLNRTAHEYAVRVDERTLKVLQTAAQFSARSGGVFDITLAPPLVALNLLPDLAAAAPPDPAATWKDIVLQPDGCVRFLRPLWIDLGGIAKGFAVDRAIATLATFAPPQACVNAGGDIRVFGAEPELVQLDLVDRDSAELPLIEVSNAALASSGASPSGPHFDGTTRRQVTAERFVSVWAPTCVVADALTKVVMARGAAARDVLRHFGARAVFHDTRQGWSQVA
jgi:thiamine biosynthesis lipoprotein